jgi:hypothetical protein
MWRVFSRGSCYGPFIIKDNHENAGVWNCWLTRFVRFIDIKFDEDFFNSRYVIRAVTDLDIILMSSRKKWGDSLFCDIVDNCKIRQNI